MYMEDLQKIKNILDLLEKINWAEQEDVRYLLILTNRVNMLISESENKPKYQLNLLDLVNISEPLTSQLLKLLFKYQYKNKYVICEAFLKHFLTSSGYNPDLFSCPKITAETDHIDLCIQEKGKYAVIIENKLKGAVFQRNQLARYIQKMRNEGYHEDQIFIIVLPGYVDCNFFEHINKSVWRLPADWHKPNQERACASSDAVSCMCDFDKTCSMCNNCETDLKDKFKSRTLVLDIAMLEWFEKNCISLMPTDELLLITAIIQFIDFLKGLYSKRLNDKLIMELENFLRDELLKEKPTLLDQWNTLESKRKEVENLQKGLESLQKSIGESMIDEWREQLIGQWKDLKFEEHKSFGINIEGVWCGCWCDASCHTPYWGFQCDNPTDPQKEMVNYILDTVGISQDKRKKGTGWIAWCETLHGKDRCEAFFKAAKEYIEQTH